MGNGLVLKFKGNKSFVAFSNLGDAEALTKTWKVCTKVAAHLEQGQRLENLSWRLWHLQNLMVESDNAKSKREFRKLSKHMGEKLDKEKGRSIEELKAPRFHRNQSTDKVRRLAEEKERNRESQHQQSAGHRLNRMQFTFEVENTASEATQPTSAPPAKKNVTIKKAATTAKKERDHSTTGDIDSDVTMDISPQLFPNPMASPNFFELNPSASTTATNATTTNATTPELGGNGVIEPQTLSFPSIFPTSSSFTPTALLYSSHSTVPSLSYGEGGGARGSFGVRRPTIEVPLDELLGRSESPEDGVGDVTTTTTTGGWVFEPIKEEDPFGEQGTAKADGKFNLDTNNNNTNNSTNTATTRTTSNNKTSTVPEMIDRAKTPKQTTIMSSSTTSSATPNTKANKALTVSTKNLTSSSSSSRGRRTSSAATTSNATRTPTTRSSTTTTTTTSTTTTTPITTTPTTAATTPPTSVATTGGKSECVNCGATHTPLWRRGLNDELNCNACGLYCKLHKRPRPKTMRGSESSSSGRGGGSGSNSPTKGNSGGGLGGGGDNNSLTSPTSNSSATMGEPARCVNCHTMATPLWRKDDEGKTVCNACGLYFKLHNANRPISMKSDVIRKRSRADQQPQQQHLQQQPQRRASISVVSAGDTPSASPEVSRRSSPDPEREEDDQDDIDEDDLTPPPSSPTSSIAHPPVIFDPNHARFTFPADEFDFPGSSASPQLTHSELASMNLEMMNFSNTSGGWPPQPYPPYPTSANVGVTGGGGYGDMEGAFPGPFHPDYLRSLGVNILDTTTGGGTPSQQHGETSDMVIGIGAPHHDEEFRGHKRRRLSTDSYQSSITDPPPTASSSAGSSFFPHDNSSSASFSSIGYPVEKQESLDLDLDGVGVDDFPMVDFLQVHGPVEQHHQHLLQYSHHLPLTASGYHPPMAVPVNGPNGNDANNTNTANHSDNDFMEITMGLFNNAPF